MDKMMIMMMTMQYKKKYNKLMRLNKIAKLVKEMMRINKMINNNLTKNKKRSFLKQLIVPRN